MFKRNIIIILGVLIGLWVILSGMCPATPASAQSFGRLPVQANGRIKPMDTLARNALLVISGRQHVKINERHLEPTVWLMDVLMKPEVADSYPIFRIDHSDVLGLLGWKKSKKKHFSFNQLKPYFEEIHQQAGRVPSEVGLQTPFEQQLLQLHDGLTLYFELGHIIHTMGILDDPELEYRAWLSSIEPGMEAIRAQELEQSFETSDMQRFIVFADRYLEVSKISPVGITPTVVGPDEGSEKWNNIGQALLDNIVTRQGDSVVLGYGRAIKAYRLGDNDGFVAAIAALDDAFNGKYDKTKVQFEYFFNQVAPFYKSLILYVLTFIAIVIGWLLKNDKFKLLGLVLISFALLLHTFGLIARIYIQARPPVTNLYSASLFIGWAAVGMGLFLERFYRQGLAVATASIVGCCTLIIAHYLSMEGDTLEMMRAVLDSNFWLSTHVIVITLGYAAMFIAGFLGVLYVLIGLKAKSLRIKLLKNLVQMVYGVLFFALLFSFVGTMLGGIWADQSWGRFWGWDPKENGALMIVLWVAITLHAKWGKMIKDCGFMLMAIAGNIITSWSFLGTNMLGVGLHSYGFMDKAFFWLTVFILSQLAFILVGAFGLKRK